ncbi:MAG TPA: hypothetical protein VGM84_04805 [Steroidobacteraceae bacterium]|jgi:hypothetical protein
MTTATVRHVVWLAAALLDGAIPGIAAAAASSEARSIGASSTTSGQQPATRFGHDLIVRLEHLPKRYSCDDLWYRFRDVLRALGARADFTARPERAEIQPGTGTWKDGDCALLRQIKSTLLPAISAKVVNFHLACGASPIAKPPFELTVTTLLPAEGSGAAVASTATTTGLDARTASAAEASVPGATTHH